VCACLTAVFLRLFEANYLLIVRAQAPAYTQFCVCCVRYVLRQLALAVMFLYGEDMAIEEVADSLRGNFFFVCLN
jgi:hypothetical protein